MKILYTKSIRTETEDGFTLRTGVWHDKSCNGEPIASYAWGVLRFAIANDLAERLGTRSRHIYLEQGW